MAGSCLLTVIGTNEPRVVRLFPATTCSCPAKANCYHILAARTAIGVTSNSKKRTINLTQLRKNTRKRADKTCGRKRPRLEDVDVVPADYHDDDQTAALHDAININQPSDAGNNPEAEATETSPDDNVQTVRADICHACSTAQPPAGKCRRRRIINWVCCDQCDRWYHTCCVHLSKIPDTYVCGLCDWQLLCSLIDSWTDSRVCVITDFRLRTWTLSWVIVIASSHRLVFDTVWVWYNFSKVMTSITLCFVL